MHQRKRPNFHRPLALLLALALCLTMAAPALAAENAIASSIQLSKTEGTVSATNSAGRSISLIKNLRLFSGYHVLTKADSYAWLNLDSAKLLKVDASSETEVRKSGKKLEVLLCSGNLFFNVTEPLDDDETLNIRTSTTLTGVRGTCGWVNVIDRRSTQVCILEGTVECVVSDAVSGESKSTTIRAGEVATFTVHPEEASALKGERCEIVTERCAVEDVPGYVLVELVEDEALCKDILDASGLDILADLSQNGDPAAEAQRRLEEEERENADRLASIAAQEQAQANNVESAPYTPSTPATPNPAAPNPAIPSDLTMVGTWGWKYDASTKTLYIGGSGAMNDYSVNRDIPWYAQYGQEIESVVIGEGITSIGENLFQGCSSLTSITIPPSVTSIGNRAFYYCSSLTSITIPNGVTRIGEAAFHGCSSLTSITIPSSVTSIGEAAFSRCSNLTSITIPSGVTSIGANTFDICTSLASVTMPDSVTSIGEAAFRNCSSLTSVTIPNRVIRIGISAFSGCSNLTSIAIPSSVAGINTYAFSDCTNLTDVYYSGSAEQWNAIYISSSGNLPLTSANIHYNSR